MKLSRTLLAGAGAAAGAWWLLRPRAPFPPWARAEPRGSAQALITGASAGLGAEYARQLAGRGYNLVLVARRADRLEALADEITATYGVRADVLAADLTTDEGVQQVEQCIAGLEHLDILVNNAGFGTTGRLAKTDPGRQQEMVYLHVLAAMRLAQAALPGMTARQRGAIINVASVAAFAPLPGNVNYHASKRYLVAFAEGLQREVRGSGVYVQALCPGYTHTDFHSTEDLKRFNKSATPAFIWLNAADVVRDSLNDLGSGRAVIVPNPLYKGLVALLRTPVVGDALLSAAGLVR
jgi:short-subunit dehydrogenase